MKDKKNRRGKVLRTVTTVNGRKWAVVEFTAVNNAGVKIKRTKRIWFTELRRP